MAVSNGLASLGDGFLNGFQVADQSIARRQDAADREAALQQEKTNSDRNYSLSSAQFDYDKQNADRQYQRQLSLDQVNQQQFQQKLGLEKQGLGLQSQELGVRAAEANAQIANLNYQRYVAQKNDRLTAEAPVAQAFYAGFKSGNPDWSLVGKMSPDNPVNPMRFIGVDKIKTAAQVQQLMPQVLNGSIDYNDPKVIGLVNTVLQPHIQTGIGTVDPDNGQTITGKQLAHIGITQDGKNAILGIKVSYANGSSALKPMTQFGSTNSQDPNITTPMPNLINEIGAYSMAVGKLNQPGDPLSAVAKMVDPSQNATIQAYRKDMLDVGTSRAKALAKATDPQSTDAVNDQYDKLEDQVDQSYGIPPSHYWQNDPLLNTFVGATQKATGKLPDLTNPATKQAFLQWKQYNANQAGGTGQLAASQPAGTQGQSAVAGQQGAAQQQNVDPATVIANKIRLSRFGQH